MADSQLYSRDITGRPVQAPDEEAAQRLAAIGNKPISEGEAKESAEAARNLDYVDQNWGSAGTAAMGALSGLSLGLAPGALASIGMVDPGALRAAETNPLYTVGDVAGTMAPALLSGGESLAARGLALTPAGVLGRLGTVSERLAGSVLGEAPGVLGRLASTPVKMAARGATEGALINIGHTVGDNLVQNKPLAAEAIWAAGLDGALGGGLIGGGLGTIGMLGEKAVESAGSLAKNVIGKGSRATGVVGRSLGMSEAALEDAERIPGGVKGKLRAYGEGLREHGAEIGSDTATKLEASRMWSSTQQAIRSEVVQSLDSQAPTMVPSLERIRDRVSNDVIAPRLHTVNESKVAAMVDGWSSRLGNIYKDGKATWAKLVESRNQLAESIKSTAHNPLLADVNTVKREILNSIDSEIRFGMEEASGLPGLRGSAERFGATQTGLKLSKELEGHLGSKAAQELMSSSPAIGPADVGSFVGMTAIGHPAAGIGWLAAKGIGKILQSKAEPWMAQMAYNQSIGGKAAKATVDAKSKISNGVKNFFKNTSKTPYYAAQVSSAEREGKSKPRSGHSRAEYESAASRVENLLSSNHQERINQYADHLRDQGYGALASSLLDVNHRAVQYATWNLPPSLGVKQLGSLRRQPAPEGLTLPEYKFLRQYKGFAQPLSLLDDLESGSISTDSVRAMKYTYPELHSELVGEFQQHVYEKKAAGETLPMDKIALASVALDAPIDVTMTGKFIGPVQAELNAPPPEPLDSPDQPPQTTVATRSTGLLTPTEQITLV